MNIEIVSITIDDQQLVPALRVLLICKCYMNLEVPLSMSGKLLAEDGKVIAILMENDIVRESTMGLKILDQPTREKYFNKNFVQPYEAWLGCSLSAKAINHLENLRQKRTEKSVQLMARLNIKVLDMPTVPQEDLPVQTMIPTLSFQAKKAECHYTIQQTDWINHFSNRLGIGDFFLLEMEAPITGAIAQEWRAFFDRSLQRVHDMREAIQHQDWQKAMFYARMFYENLKFNEQRAGSKTLKDQLRLLFAQEQHGEEGFEALFKGISNFFNYTSKFIHDKDRAGGLNPVPIAAKEDAYFVYTLAIGLLQIIRKKLRS